MTEARAPAALPRALVVMMLMLAALFNVVGRSVPSIYVGPDAERPVRLAFAQFQERVARAVRARL
ncbi:hypothetical protein [Curtobacterium sp. 'Ferrero']|uniref:hypothetical protein n=1 Tax=Curtobacterium sp. 'Ferrero' TaxID=2033654 RepID=UPI001596ACC6|nr:hypothetical protein [Curtobacterium sp. 'Ferrero']